MSAEVIDLVEDDEVEIIAVETPRKRSKDEPMAISLIDEIQINNNFFLTEEELPRKHSEITLLRKIYNVLKDVVTHSKFSVTYEWNFQELTDLAKSFKLVFTSRFHAQRRYILQLIFSPQFPEQAPEFRCLTLLPPNEFCVMNNHPCMQRHLWSPSTSFSELIHLCLFHLESMNFNYSTLTLPLFGGGYGQRNTLEEAIAELFGKYRTLIKSKSIESMSNKLMPDNLCVCIGVTSAQKTTTFGNKSTGKGTGYSVGSSNYYSNANATVAPNVTDTSRIKFLVSCIHEMIVNAWNKKKSLPQTRETWNQQQLQLLWLLHSPLLELLFCLLNECSSEEIYRHQEFIGQLSNLTLRLEWILESVLQYENNNNSVLIRQSEMQPLFQQIYQKIFQAKEQDLFEKKRQWLSDLEKLSTCYQQMFIQSTTSMITNTSLSSSSSSSSTSIAVNNIPSTATGKVAATATTPAASTPPSRLHYVSGIESKHLFMKSGVQVEACSKAWHRELKFLNENLSDEVTVFVSEDHPNYLFALMSILNDDCPYYGGTFVFHIMVPQQYPKIPPKVLLGTTGEGSVRFNPNLYNCGKVCLSLLGTWSGEPWCPKTSNMTQVLKSILYLIFTDEPYYNEPGYHRPASGIDQNSLNYNLAVMQNTTRYAILYHLQKPEDFYGPVEIQHYIRNYYEENWHYLPSTSTGSSASSSTVIVLDGNTTTPPITMSMKDKLKKLYKAFPAMSSAASTTLNTTLDQIDLQLQTKKRSISIAGVTK
jgi:ubiquitin-protein ligase